ncbi:MAG: hypothetical protein ACJA1A_000958 [Saprospiraceae bacterium]|jgi:hypothetical protein
MIEYIIIQSVLVFTETYTASLINCKVNIYQKKANLIKSWPYLVHSIFYTFSIE